VEFEVGQANGKRFTFFLLHQDIAALPIGCEVKVICHKTKLACQSWLTAVEIRACECRELKA
jgi:hypothetical protein